MAPVNLAPAIEDVLAEVLASGGVHGGTCVRLQLGDPSQRSFPQRLRAGFHAVLAGEVQLELAAEPAPARAVAPRRHDASTAATTMLLEQADLVLLPHGSEHTVIAASPGADRSTGPADRRAATAELLCGALYFGGAGVPPVLERLPRCVIVRGALRTEPLRGVAALLLAEAARPTTTAAMISRLVELTLLLAVRTWAERQPVEAQPWTRALTDRNLGALLLEIHRNPGHPWRISEMARRAAMSLASFKRRFHEGLGVAPMTYVTRVRIDAAAVALRTSERSVAEIASMVGYASDFAFARAFRRARGLSPARYRLATLV